MSNAQGPYLELVAWASERTGIPAPAIMSASRVDQLVVVRYWIWERMRKRGFSHVAIGQVAGRDHSTVIHGVCKIADYRNAKKWRWIFKKLEGRNPATKPRKPLEPLTLRNVIAREAMPVLADATGQTAGVPIVHQGVKRIVRFERVDGGWRYMDSEFCFPI